MRQSGYSLYAPPNTANMLHRTHLPCTLVLEPLARVQLDNFAIVVIGLPDAPGATQHDDVCPEDANRCSMLILAASLAANMRQSLAVIGHHSQYGMVSEELARFRAIRPPMRMRLATNAFYIASEWASRMARKRRHLDAIAALC